MELDNYQLTKEQAEEREAKEKELAEVQELLTGKFGKKYTAVPSKKIKGLAELYEDKLTSFYNSTGDERTIAQNEASMLRLVLTYYLNSQTEKQLSDRVNDAKKRAGVKV